MFQSSNAGGVISMSGHNACERTDHTATRSFVVTPCNSEIHVHRHCVNTAALVGYDRGGFDVPVDEDKVDLIQEPRPERAAVTPCVVRTHITIKVD